jgi:hypothetical protein
LKIISPYLSESQETFTFLQFNSSKVDQYFHDEKHHANSLANGQNLAFIHFLKSYSQRIENGQQYDENNTENG